MKTVIALVFAGLSLSVFALENQPPNFVVIMGEAQGWASSSVQMDDSVPASKSSIARTPNLESIAASGTRFANFYAASPRCMPTRAALFTGRSPAALHMTYIGEGKRDDGGDASRKILPPKCLLELPPSEVTVAALLKRAGYVSAHFGKWHVGRIDPARYGFDESDGATSNVGPGGDLKPNPKQAFSMTERGMDFMIRQTKAGKPFYLQVSHYAGNGGEDARPETYAAVRRRVKPGEEKLVESVAMTEDMDETIGQLLKKIDDLGIAGRTYVIYTADHGTKGHNANGPLSGGKGSVWEGGIRVPLLVKGPGIKGGECSQARASTVDLLPTIAALAGVKEPLPAGVEGGSLKPVLLGGAPRVVRAREAWVAHFPHYDKDDLGPASALILGTEKLVRAYETGHLHLFNLASDRGERHDLSAEKPARAAELNRLLGEYLLEVKAQMPSANPGYDPSAPASPMQRKGDKRKEK